MRGFRAGLIAGMVAGVVLSLGRVVETSFGLPSAEVILTWDFMSAHIGYSVGVIGIFGGFFGIVYSKFYDGIPAKGVKKSLVYGLIVLLFTSLWAVSYNIILAFLTGMEIFLVWALAWGLVLHVWITYGLVLGVLYERWK